MFNEGQEIGLYTLIHKLGEGGFGEVWLAENRRNSPSEKVAIKLPRKDQIDLLAVKEEIFNWILSGKHKNILPIIECETFGNQIAIVSEFAPDGSLQDLINNRKGALSIADSVEITIGILDGLAHLHNRKIIHRDLKPDNVLFQGKTPRLTDFGISRAMTIGSQSQTISGTLSYMAPEAFDGKRNEQTDIWSVGVILYQLLTGNLPFPQKEIIQLVGALAREEPAPLPESVPPVLQYIIKTSLGKTTTERYKSANEMREELNNFRATHSSLFALPTTESYIPIDEEETISSQKPFSPQDRQKPLDTTKRIVGPTPLNNESNPLYYAVATIVLIFLTLFGINYLFNKKPENTNPPTNPQSSPSATVSSKINENTKFIPFRKGDKFGFSDENKKILIEPKYDQVSPFMKELDGLAVIVSFGSSGLSEAKMGLIDKTGKEVIPPKYDNISSEGFSEGLIAVILNKKVGFIDKTGQEVISLKYEMAGAFKDGLAPVVLNSKIGFIDKTDKEIIAFKYDVPGKDYWKFRSSDTMSFKEGLAKVMSNGKFGFIDKSGKEVIPLQYAEASTFNEGMAVVCKKTEKDSIPQCGFIDKAGKEITPLEYDRAEPFGEGLAIVCSYSNPDGCGFIDKTGKLIIPLKYDSGAESFNSGLAKVDNEFKPSKFTYIDVTGKEYIFTNYDYMIEFSDGLAYAKLNEKIGFVDKTGKEIIPFKYHSAGSFKQGLAFVTLNGKQFYIDKSGTEYYEP